MVIIPKQMQMLFVELLGMIAEFLLLEVHLATRITLTRSGTGTSNVLEMNQKYLIAR